MATVLHKLAVEINADGSKFTRGLKEAQKPLQGFTSGLKSFGNQTNIAGHNIGGLASTIASFANPVTAAAGAVTLLGGAFLKTYEGAELLEEGQFALEASIQVLGKETGKFIDTLTDEDTALGRVTNKVIDIVTEYNIWAMAIKAIDKITSDHASSIINEIAALQELKAAYDDLSRERIIDSENVSELERRIEALKTAREEEGVTIAKRIAIDRQLLELENERFRLLQNDAIKRLQNLEVQADGIADVTNAMSEQERQQAINNSLEEKQLELLINTRNEVKDLEAEYSRRIRKIQKELTGLLRELDKVKSSSGFAFSPGEDTGDANFPGLFQDPEKFNQSIEEAFDTTMMDGAIEGWGSLSEKINEAQLAMYDFQEATGEVAISLDTLISNSIIGLGEALGDEIAGVGHGATNLLKVFADFAGQFGKILVAAGVGALALKKLLVSNPAAVIAAGFGLVAISRIAGAAIQNAQSNIGKGQSSSSVGVGASTASLQPQNIDVTVTGRLSGNDIIISGQRTAEKNRQTRAGG